jgi:hypothetical protein
MSDTACRTEACGHPIDPTESRVSSRSPSRQTTQAAQLCALAVELEASIPRGIHDFCPRIIDRLSGPERLDRDKIYTRRFMHVPMNSRRSTRFSSFSPEDKGGSTLLRLGFWLYDRRPFRAEK